MPDDLQRAFAALSSDSERGLLLTGPELRYQAERRRSRRAGLTATATAVLVAAALGAGWAVTNADGGQSASPPTGSGPGPAPVVSRTPSLAPPSSALPSDPPSTTPPSSAPPPPVTPSVRPPTSEPAVVAEAIPEKVPDQVLLAQTDANATVTEMPKPFGVPEFCAAATFASQKQLGVSASRVSRYRKPDTPPENIPDDGVYNTVGVYRGDGAEDYLTDLRRATDVCATSRVRGLDARFGLLAPLGVGDESVLIERSYEDVDAEGRPVKNGRWLNTYVAAVRIGDAVTLIDCRGYENLSSDVTTARTLGTALAKRLDAWRG
ncbi:hypothetical protein [Paractinoplanes maris]|uniref:hypothetical protein n=1 Tax=Paractinoplanes maris TaxID=1734446 RepID=UPI002020004B|nr:hypothetical protein [Actinoplanes maris]